MILIIDGCDKVGKSTLIENLKNKIDHLLLMKILDKPQDASNAERQKIKDHYEEMFQIHKDHPYFIYVMDRWFTSEMAYSFKRGYEAMDDPWFKEFDEQVANKKNLFVLLEADRTLVKQRFVQDKETFTKGHEVEMIMDRYEKIFEWSQMNKLRLNTTKDLDGAISKIIQAVNTVDAKNIRVGKEFE